MTFFDNMSWLLPLPEKALERLKQGDIDLELVQRLGGYRINDRQAHKITRGVGMLDSIPGTHPVRVAILTDCNLDFCKDLLVATGLRYGLNLDVMMVEYSDILAQAMDPDSALYRFAPNFILHAGFGALLNTVVATYAEQDTGLATQAVQRMRNELRAARDALARNCSAQQLLQTMPATQADLFGSIDRSQPQTFGYEVQGYNAALHEMDLPVIDIERLASRIGTYRWFDDGKYHWTKAPFDLQWAEHYCDTVVRRVSLAVGRGKKCLILDLDNTLWGGVIGDDGVNGIALGNNSAVGEAFLAGQRYYKMLANRGVVLAVCSKNDMSNAVLPFDSHPDMILKTSDIACFVANWQDKPSNIRYISEALNLGLDSFVFLDDNPMERDLVRQELPQVAVPQVADENASLYPRIIEAAGYFEAAGFTAADLNRVFDYRANAQRVEIQRSATDIDAYLAELEMQFQFTPFDPVNEDRIVQLINRSNQFNLTTKRYTNAEIQALYAVEDRFGYTARLIDKFADTGLIAAFIFQQSQLDGKPAWEIDTWLMSCRVLGRKVEQASLLRIAETARDHGALALIGRFIPTAKNGMVKDHYERLGFEPIDNPELVAGLSEGETLWRLSIGDYLTSYAEQDPLPFEFI